MKLVLHQGRFEVQGYNKKVPGFATDPDTGIQFTTDAHTAKALLHYAEPDAEFEIYKREAEMKVVLAQSHALDSNIVVPVPKGKVYDPYQLAAIKYGIQREAVWLCDEMGLGKTQEAIGIINWLLAHNPAFRYKRGLVICQNHLKDHWANHLGSWLIEEHGIDITLSDWFPEYAQWVIVNYESVSKWEDKLKMMPWGFVIIDEFHNLSNPKANRTRQVYGNPRLGIEAIKADKIIMISGSPFNNRTKELFPSLHFADPVVWPDFHSFGIKFCGATQKRNGDWEYNGASNESELQAKLRTTLMIRRLKDDVLKDLPPKRRQVIEIPPGDIDLEWIKEAQEAYDSYEHKIAEAKVKAEQAKINNDETEYKRAMQALRYTRSIQFKKMSKFRYKTAIAKLPFVMAHLEDVLADGRKVVVFGHHHKVLETIFEKYKDIALINYGGKYQTMSAVEAAEIFQTDPKYQIYLCSIRKCEGLTLTAAHHEVFAELDWVPSKMKQAEDRAHRRGSTGEFILIQTIVLMHSLDAKMAHKIVEKLAIMEAVLDKGEDWIDPDPIFLDEDIDEVQEEYEFSANTP